MKKIEYVMLSPARNLTGLVLTDLPSSLYVPASNFLLQSMYIGAEQIGFITAPQDEKAVIRLNMPNNEFCGDGALATAVLAHWLKWTDKNQFYIEVSGTEDIMRTELEPTSQYEYYCKAEMPLRHNLKFMELCVGENTVSGSLVELSGMSYFVVHSTDINGSKEMIVSLIKDLAQKHEAKAYGLVVYEECPHGIRLIPCIYIPKTGKLMFESACGSGTAALGIFLASHKRADIKKHVIQPGGILDIEVVVNDVASLEQAVEIVHVTLGGFVQITGKGTVFVSEM